MSRNWKPPHHGEKSKYVHVRLRAPSRYSKMRTTTVGHGCKQVYGKLKGKQKWEAQNIMIPKSLVSLSKDGVHISSPSVRKKLKDMGLRISRIRKFKSGGSADYRYVGGK